MNNGRAFELQKKKIHPVDIGRDIMWYDNKLSVQCFVFKYITCVYNTTLSSARVIKMYKKEKTFNFYR